MARGGRGGKSGSSLTQEQMQSLGIGPGMNKEMPSIAAPPPTFPPLMSKPVPLETSAAENYKILWKEDFLNYMRDSPYYLLPKVHKDIIQRFSDQYNQTLDKNKEKRKLDIPYENLPLELWSSSGKRKRISKKLKDKKAKFSVEQRLKVLEQKEKTDDNEDKDKHSDTEDEAQEEQEIEIEDDEMDEENDYGNNYFDNGEGFNEEDDNLDDGPIY